MSTNIPTQRNPLRTRLILGASSTLLVLGLIELGVRALVSPQVEGEGHYEQLDRENLAAWEQRHAKGRGLFGGGHDHHPMIGWVPRPLLRDHRGIGTSAVSTNSHGMRGHREFEQDKPSGVQRIALLGDSFTFGNDSPDSAIWPALLQARLPAVEVLNFGVSGHGSDQALLSFQERARAFAPDVVVWTVFSGDLKRSMQRFSFFAKPRYELRATSLQLGGTPVPTADELLQSPEDFLRSAAARAPLSHALHYLRTRARPEPLDELLRLNHAIVRELVREVEAAGAQLLVVVIPGSFAEGRRALLDWSDELGFPALESRELLAAAQGRPIARGGHFSEAGHLAFADALAADLSQRAWLAAPEGH